MARAILKRSKVLVMDEVSRSQHILPTAFNSFELGDCKVSLGYKPIKMVFLILGFQRRLRN